MAKKEIKTNKKENSKNKKSFSKDFKAELKKVVWPTPKQLLNNTVAVITIVLNYFVSLCVVRFLQNLQYLTISNLSVLFLLFFEVM